MSKSLRYLNSSRTGFESLDQIETELTGILDADSKYWRENDAKFRAVAQNASYEQFEEIVKASHIKPLQRSDKISTADLQTNTVWNSFSKGKPTVRTEAAAVSRLEDAMRGKTIDDKRCVKSIDQFKKEWKSIRCGDRMDFLVQLGLPSFTKLFMADIPPELLAEFLQTFLYNVDFDANLSGALPYLEGIVSSKRFKLSLQFLSNSERETAAQLMKKLQSYNTDMNESEVKSRIQNVVEKFSLHDTNHRL